MKYNTLQIGRVLSPACPQASSVPLQMIHCGSSVEWLPSASKVTASCLDLPLWNFDGIESNIADR